MWSTSIYHLGKLLWGIFPLSPVSTGLQQDVGEWFQGLRGCLTDFTHVFDSSTIAVSNFCLSLCIATGSCSHKT